MGLDQVMDRLDCDRMFVAVLDTGSFAAAAQRLGTSSGQASKLISKLEADLGVQLITRTTRALSPTEVGQAYYQRIKGLLEEFEALDAAVRHASGAPTGRLRLTAPMSFGTVQLAPLLLQFAEAYPEIHLDVAFSDRVMNLVDDGFDAAVRIGAPADSSLIARRLCDSRVVVIASADYLARRGRPDHPASLTAHDCIIDTNFREPWTWRFSDPGDRQPLAVPVSGRLSFSNGEVCVRAAEAGLGMTRLPSFLAGESLRAGRVCRVLGAFEPPPVGIYALYPAGKHLALKVRVLVDFLVSRFRGEPVWDQGWPEEGGAGESEAAAAPLLSRRS